MLFKISECHNTIYEFIEKITILIAEINDIEYNFLKYSTIEDRFWRTSGRTGFLEDNWEDRF